MVVAVLFSLVLHLIRVRGFSQVFDFEANELVHLLAHRNNYYNHHKYWPNPIRYSMTKLIELNQYEGIL